MPVPSVTTLHALSTKVSQRFTVLLRFEAITALMTANDIRNQADLAKRIGVTRSCITRLLKNQRNPSAEVIAAFLRAFPNITFDDLFVCAEVVRPETQDETVSA